MKTSTVFAYLVRPPEGRQVAVMTKQELAPGTLVVVETPDGVWCLPLQRWPAKISEKWPQGQLIRVASEKDRARLTQSQAKAQKAHTQCLMQIGKLGLEMRLSRTLMTFDQAKLIFYFTAPKRVDFRHLLQSLIKDWRGVKIALRQLGARQEAGQYGGLGPCGRELCCSTFLKQFEHITLQLAEDQGLPPNPARLSGNCGRLKCCLQYEQDYYLYLREQMPPLGARVRVGDAEAKVVRHLVLSESVEILLNKRLQVVPYQELEPLS